MRLYGDDPEVMDSARFRLRCFVDASPLVRADALTFYQEKLVRDAILGEYSRLTGEHRELQERYLRLIKNGGPSLP
jgi:hypothetical protein